MRTIKLHTILILNTTIITLSSVPTFASGMPREAIPKNTPQSAIGVAEH